MPAATLAASRAAGLVSGRSSTTATSAALRNMPGDRAAELQPGIFVEARGLAGADRHQPVERCLPARYSSTTRRTCRRNRRSRNARSSGLAGSQALAASLRPPSSADSTTTLPFFGAACLAKPMVGLEVMTGPAVMGMCVASSARHLVRFAAFGKTSTPTTAYMHVRSTIADNAAAMYTSGLFQLVR